MVLRDFFFFLNWTAWRNKINLSGIPFFLDQTSMNMNKIY